MHPSLMNVKCESDFSYLFNYFNFNFYFRFPMPKGWPTVKENLPNFGFLEIQNADAKNDIVRIESDYGNEIFWDSLNLNENIPNNNKDKEEL